MGNIKSTPPQGILKPPPKSVRWATHARVYPIDNYESDPLLKSHQANMMEARIKAAPILAPIKRPAVTVRPQPPKPKWKWWQKLLRGRQEVLLAAIAATVFACCAAGPFGLIVPAVYLIYLAAVFIYRNAGPQPKELAAQQQFNARLALRYASKAKALRAAGQYQHARQYDQLVKRLKP